MTRYEINYAKNASQSKFGAIIAAAVIFSAIAIFAIFSMSGCATANTVKKQIAGDLQIIAQQDDCATSCMLLKEYIKTKLSGL